DLRHDEALLERGETRRFGDLLRGELLPGEDIEALQPGLARELQHALAARGVRAAGLEKEAVRALLHHARRPGPVDHHPALALGLAGGGARRCGAVRADQEVGPAV